jgi:small subunit ribosomal protein S6
MRRYEQVCILRPSLSEEEISRIIDTATQLIQEDEGSVIFLNKWGMRKLAYPIKKESQGYYILCDFAASPAVVAEIERKFRIDDAVLKYLTVKISDAISGEEIETARSEAEASAIVPEAEEEPAAAAEEKPQESSSKTEGAQEAEAVEAPTEKEATEASPEPESDAQQPEEPVQ